MTIPEKLKYTKDHEWVRIEGEIGVVGITDYAQGQLGDIVFVDLPAISRQVKQGDSFGTIEAVKAVSDLYAPLSGAVTEINQELQKSSDLVNKDPYGRGWMIKIKVKDMKELDNLLDAREYSELVGK
jgi:glycine cleavage system H protein